MANLPMQWWVRKTLPTHNPTGLVLAQTRGQIPFIGHMRFGAKIIACGLPIPVTGGYGLMPAAHTLNWTYDACFTDQGLAVADTGNSRICIWDQMPHTHNVSANEQYAISEETRKGIMRGSLLEYGLEELDLILADLLEKEDYESAAKVRDVIRKKQNKQDT